MTIRHAADRTALAMFFGAPTAGIAGYVSPAFSVVAVACMAISSIYILGVLLFEDDHRSGA